jgi:hypothetical protein
MSVAAIGILLPYLARLPGVARHGSTWLTSYFPSFGAMVFLGVFNLLPVATLFALRRLDKNRDVPVRVAAFLAYLFLFYNHAVLNLAADAQAAIALIFIPVAAVPVALIGYGCGLLCEKLAKYRSGTPD